MSDTHGQVDLALAAVKEFIFRGIEAVIHCGDIGSDMVLTEMTSMLQTLDIPVYAVLGNTDMHIDYSTFPDNVGVRLMGRFGEIELAGRRIAVMHSDDEDHFERTVDSCDYDYVFFGHTHVCHDEKREKTRLINPGAAGRGMHPSCAVLDLVEDDLEYFTIRRSG